MTRSTVHSPDTPEQNDRAARGRHPVWKTAPGRGGKTAVPSRRESRGGEGAAVWEMDPGNRWTLDRGRMMRAWPNGGGGLVIRGRPPSIFCLSLAHGFDSAGDPRPAESVSFFPGHSFGGKVKTEVNTFYVGHIFRLSPRKNRYGGRLRVPAGDVKVWRKSPRIQRRAAEGLGLLTAISYVLFALHLSLKTKDSGGAACSGESRAVPDCSLSNDSLVCRNSFPRRPTRCPFFP
jgi:hypothetical protein